MGTVVHESQDLSVHMSSSCHSSQSYIASTPGSITLIVGCMFSGKTTALLKHLEAVPTNQRLLFKHTLDTRYCDDAVVSHNGLALPAIAITKACELEDHCGKNVTMVGLDEGHFFDRSVIQTAQKMASAGVNFVITALDRDSWGQPFPLMQSLGENASTVTFLTATCAQCQGEADRTQRLLPIVDGNMIGGCESYEPRCATCWHQPPESPVKYTRQGT